MDPRPTRPGSKVARAATEAAAAATTTPTSASWPLGNTISALSGPSRCAISQSYSSQSIAQLAAKGSASYETNEDLGSLDEEIGVIEVERVSPRFSVARIVEGQGFAPGNIVRPVESF